MKYIPRIKINLDFFHENLDQIHPEYLTKVLGEFVYEDLIAYSKYEFKWRRVSNYEKMSYNFIRKHQDLLCWTNISKVCTLSEEFIREFQHKVDWPWVCDSQNISESFIREFYDKIYWWSIFERSVNYEKSLRSCFTFLKYRIKKLELSEKFFIDFEKELADSRI